MKNQLVLLLFSSFLFYQCSSKQEGTEIQNEQASIQLMKELAPQLTGTWTLRQIQIKYQSFSSGLHELGIRKDTIFNDLATLTLAPSAYQPIATNSRYEGVIQMGGKTCPIQFELIAGPWIFSKTGPQAYFLVDFNFPVGPVTLQPEHRYLENLGIIKETFALETPVGQPTMVWRGQNQQVAQIQFMKN